MILQGLVCHTCGQQGHLAPVCHLQPHTVGAVVHIIPVGAIAPAGTSYMSDHLEVMPRLPAMLMHSSRSFSFCCYPNTGSGASLISSDLVSCHNIQMMEHIDDTTFVTVNGEEISIIGNVHATMLLANGNKVQVHFVVSLCISDKVILGYKKLKELHVISESFPISAVSLFFSQQEAKKLKETLNNEFSDVITSILPKEAMVGGFMDIHLNDRIGPL